MSRELKALRKKLDGFGYSLELVDQELMNLNSYSLRAWLISYINGETSGEKSPKQLERLYEALEDSRRV